MMDFSEAETPEQARDIAAAWIDRNLVELILGAVLLSALLLA